MRELVSCFGILVGAYTKEMDYLQKSLEGVNDKSSGAITDIKMEITCNILEYLLIGEYMD